MINENTTLAVIASILQAVDKVAMIRFSKKGWTVTIIDNDGFVKESSTDDTIEGAFNKSICTQLN